MGSQAETFPTHAGKTLESIDASDPSLTTKYLSSILHRDGAFIARNLVPKALCERIRADLRPSFESAISDESGFFPSTTKRAYSVLAKSDACGELVVNPLFQDLAESILTSHYTYWEGQKQLHVSGKPQIASIVGFRVEPGGKQQALHRDDADYHTRNIDMPVMLGCVTVRPLSFDLLFLLKR